MAIDDQVIPSVQSRLDEVRTALRAGTALSVLFLCGNVLEALLPGAAHQAPAGFNQAMAAPKTQNGSSKPFQEWSLAQMIDVACEVSVLKADVNIFSHGLRVFCNDIHPYEKMASGLTQDDHTAKDCFQVLEAALASLARERP